MLRRLRSTCPQAALPAVAVPADAQFAITGLGRWVLERFGDPPLGLHAAPGDDPRDEVAGNDR